MAKLLGFSFTRVFSVDTRALDLFAVGLGLCLILDSINRLCSLEAHYSDLGVLPRAFLIENWIPGESFSFLLAHGSPWFAFLFLLVAILCGVLLLVGKHRKIALAIAWIALVSIQHRNPLVLQGGDIYLRLLLFWAFFLPLPVVFPRPKFIGVSATRPSSYTALPVFCLAVQVASVYFFSFLLKTGSEWTAGTAIYYALSIDQFTTSFGSWLATQHSLTKLLTISVYGLEALGPLLLFIPIRTGLCRGIAVVLFWGFHLGLLLTMKLGLFPLIGIVAWLPFIPPSWFSKDIEKKDHTPGKFEISHERSPSLLLRDLFAFLCVVYITLWNIRTLDEERFKNVLPQQFNRFGYAFSLDQYWNMFSPRPMLDDGWYVIEGETISGALVDVWSEKQGINWTKPESVSEYYPGQRWRKYLMNLSDDTNKLARPYFARYLCHRWNSKSKKFGRMEKVRVWFVYERTPPPGHVPKEEKKLLAELFCPITPTHGGGRVIMRR